MSEVPMLACGFSALFGAAFFGAVIATLQEEVYPAIMSWILSALLLFQIFFVISGAT